MFRPDPAPFFAPDPWFERTAFMRTTPNPGIAEPEGRKKDDLGWFFGAIRDRDPDVNIVRRLFRVLGKNVEIAAVFKNAGIDELIFGEIEISSAILADQLIVWKGRLRVLVKRFQVGVSGRRIEIKITLLDVLPMVSFRARQAK